MALLLMGLVGGGTWAYFSDTESASGNELVAGTLDLGLTTTTGSKPTGGLTTGVSTPDDWAPGDTESITIYLYNSGSIDMEEVTVKLVGEESVADGTPESVSPVTNTNTDNLLKMVNIKSATYGGVSVTSLVNETLEDLAGSGTPLELVLGDLEAGEEKAFVITFEFDPTATNGCQGDSYGFDLTFTGYQKMGQNNP